MTAVPRVSREDKLVLPGGETFHISVDSPVTISRGVVVVGLASLFLWFAVFVPMGLLSLFSWVFVCKLCGFVAYCSSGLFIGVLWVC